jgi:hypothetical protein
MSEQKMSSGSWLVIGLVTVGVIAGLAALKFRRYPGQGSATQPTTTSTTPAR